MALYTKKLIMSTFQEMLEELPFDKITVAALVKRAGISPNTFTIIIRISMLCWMLGFGKGQKHLSPVVPQLNGKAPPRRYCINARRIRKQFIMCSTVFPVTAWSGTSSL